MSNQSKRRKVEAEPEGEVVDGGVIKLTGTCTRCVQKDEMDPSQMLLLHSTRLLALQTSFSHSPSSIPMQRPARMCASSNCPIYNIISSTSEQPFRPTSYSRTTLATHTTST